MNTPRATYAWHSGQGKYVKTKPRAPWTVKPGDEICLWLGPSPGPRTNPETVTVTKTTRHIGTFTGATVFRMHYVNASNQRAEHVDCHGKLNRLPAEKILVPA